jgi:ubiquinone/menaquinone biosynthesis C-methylase UbiE
MKSSSAAFHGSIPEYYDRHLGPAFFEPYAADLISRLPARQYGAILEIACGTGIVTRQLRDRLPIETRIVATDLNRAMFEYAARKFKPGEKVEWQEADATVLPFADQEFDAVFCQYGFMFVPDKDAAFREAHRVLKSGGVLLFNVWDSLEHNEIPRLTHQTIASFFEQDPPRFYQVPFGYHDTDVARQSLQNAGFAEVESFVVKLPCRSPSAHDFAIGLVRGNPVVMEIEERGSVDVDTVIKAVANALTKRFGGGPIEATMQALVWRALRH